MDDFHALGHACLARKAVTKAVDRWMNGLDAGDGRCGDAIAALIRDLCPPGNLWEKIANFYLGCDLSDQGERSFHGRKVVGMKEVPLRTVDWPAFSFAPHPLLADLTAEPTEAWRCFKDFCRESDISVVQWGQNYATGLWQADLAMTVFRLESTSSTIAIRLFISAAADGSGLHIATPLCRGSRVAGVRPSQRWLLEAFFRLSEDVSREYVGSLTGQLRGLKAFGGELYGRALMFKEQEVRDKDTLYVNADFFPRPVVWSAEMNWKVLGETVMRSFQPAPELWAGYFVPANPDTQQLKECIHGAVSSIRELADWYTAVFGATANCPLPTPDTGDELSGAVNSQMLFAILLFGGTPVPWVTAGDDDDCWPEEALGLFAAMEQGDPVAAAKIKQLEAEWKQVSEMDSRTIARHQSTNQQPKEKGWFSWFRR